MKQYILQVLSLILLGLLSSCQFSDLEEFQMGEDFVDSNSGIVKIDTMDFYVSTVVIDSFSTSSSTRLLVGGWQNNYTGKINSTPYFQLTSGNFSIDDDDLVYDSIVFVMNYDNYYRGDTTKLMTMDVLQITETMELNDNDYISNIAKFETDPQPLGRLVFYPQPYSGNEIMTRIDQQFGETLFDMILTENDTLTNATYFAEFFKGIAIVPESSPNAMIGLSLDSTAVSPSLRIYYHEEVYESEINKKTYFTIPYMTTGGLHFNHFDKDFSGSYISGIEENDNELPSSETSEKTVIQAGTGIFTKIRIPGIPNIPGFAKRVAFISAQLSLIPLEGSYDKMNPLPDSLAVYVTDRKNNVTGQLANSTGSLIYATVMNNGQYDAAPYYQADLTDFFNSQITAETYTEQFLFVGPPSTLIGNSAQGVLFGRANKQVEPVELEVYCYTNNE
jgi:hypothetical protein